MAPLILPSSRIKKENKKPKDVKVVCKKIKNMKTPQKLLKSSNKKQTKNLGQIAAQSKILDKVWKKVIHEMSKESNLSPIHQEMLQKFDGQTVPRKKKKLFVKWVVASLKLKKEKYLPLIEELYGILKTCSDAEMAKLSSEKTLGTERKSRRQKLREKKLKKKLRKTLKGEEKDKMDVAFEEEKSKIEFVFPKVAVRKRKKKHLREILKEKKQQKMLEKSGSSAMEIDSESTLKPKHIKFGNDDGMEGNKLAQNKQTVVDESMEISSSPKKQKKKKKEVS